MAIGLVACGVSDENPSRDVKTGGGGESQDDRREGSAFDPARTQLTVRFQDSSVPPQYHRSYELTVVDQQAHVVVDSYGDVLHDETAKVPDDVWGPFVADLGAGVDDLEVPDARPCPGGRTITLTVTDDSNRFSTKVPACSDQTRATLDQIEALIAPITDTVDLARLTDTD